MKLLNSAYACAPNFRSDHAVGWNWVTEAHRLGHEIWLSCRPLIATRLQLLATKIPVLPAFIGSFPRCRIGRCQEASSPIGKEPIIC